MLERLKILIFENWLKFLLAVIVTFLYYKNSFLIFPLFFFVSWYLVGSFLKSAFFTFIFLPSFLILENNFNKSLLLSLILFFLTLAIFKKKKFVNWLVFFMVLFSIFYLNNFGKISFGPVLVISTAVLIFFVILFFNKSSLESLILALFFLEMSFIFTFLPLNFYWRIAVLFSFVFFLLKYNIINKEFINNN